MVDHTGIEPAILTITPHIEVSCYTCTPDNDPRKRESPRYFNMSMSSLQRFPCIYSLWHYERCDRYSLCIVNLSPLILPYCDSLSKGTAFRCDISKN